MNANHRRALRKAAESGSTIECTLSPYEGREVLYAPRNGHDPKPWTFAGSEGATSDYRYTSVECRVRPDALTVNTVAAGRALAEVVFEGDPIRVKVGFSADTLNALKSKADEDRSRYRAEMDARKAEQRRRFG